MLDLGPDQPPLRCPTCGAEQTPAETCRRCRCDLELLMAVDRAARGLYEQALLHFAQGEIAAARELAEQCCQIDRHPRHQRLLALCALAAGDFPTAAAVARRAGGDELADLRSS